MRHGRAAGETGGIITGWLATMVVTMALVALVAFEAVATAVNVVSSDDAARVVARAAATAYRDSGSDHAAALGAARMAATERGVELVDMRTGDGNVTATVRREASTLVIHHVGPLRRVVTATVSRTAHWQ